MDDASIRLNDRAYKFFYIADNCDKILNGKQKAIEGATNLLKMNVLSPEQIAQGCGLSVEEVLEIEKGIK